MLEDIAEYVVFCWDVVEFGVSYWAVALVYWWQARGLMIWTVALWSTRTQALLVHYLLLGAQSLLILLVGEAHTLNPARREILRLL